MSDQNSDNKITNRALHHPFSTSFTNETAVEKTLANYFRNFKKENCQLLRTVAFDENGNQHCASEYKLI